MHRRSLAPISKTLMCIPCNAAGIGKFRSAKAERLLPYPCEKEFTTTIKTPHRLFIGKATVHSSGVSLAKRDASYSAITHLCIWHLQRWDDADSYNFSNLNRKNQALTFLSDPPGRMQAKSTEISNQTKIHSQYHSLRLSINNH